MSDQPTEKTTRAPDACAAWLNRNVLALSFTSAFNDLHTHAMKSLLPGFMANSLHLSKSAIGLVEGVGEASAGATHWLSGWVSDRIRGRKWLAAAGYAVSLVAKLSLAIVYSFGGVLLVRLTDRLGKGIRKPPRDALLADSVSDETCGRAFGFHRAMDTGGAVLGALVAWWLLGQLGGDYRAVFLWGAIPGVIAVLSILALVRETPRRHEQGRPQDPAPGPGYLPSRFRAFLAAHGLFFLGNVSYAFFMLQAADRGTPEVTLNLLYFLWNVAYSLGAFPAGRIVDLVGGRRVLMLGYGLFAACCAGMILAPEPDMVWLWFIAYGLHRACVDTAAPAYTTALVSGRVRGTGLGLMHSLMALMALPANLVAGRLWDTAGASWTFGYALGLTSVALLVLMTVAAPRSTDASAA